MNFESANAEWQKFLREQASQISSSVDHYCKVCSCLEFMKISICGCRHDASISKEALVSDLIEGILGQENVQRLKRSLEGHTYNVNLTAIVNNRLDRLEAELRQYYDEFFKIVHQEIPSQIAQVKANLENSENVPTISPELISKLGNLENRIKDYEESLVNLNAENRTLRDLLKEAQRKKDEESAANSAAMHGLRTRYNEIKEDQAKLREKLDNLQREVAEGNSNFAVLKRDFENLGSGGVGEASREKDKIIEEQKAMLLASERTLAMLLEKHNQAENQVKSTHTELQRIQKLQEELRNWQRECIAISKHSSNLLTATDSIYSANDQFQDTLRQISEKLDELRGEIDVLKRQGPQLPQELDAYRKEVYAKRQEQSNILKVDYYHDGKYEYDPVVGRELYSCCKKEFTAQGCKGRYVL